MGNEPRKHVNNVEFVNMLNTRRYDHAFEFPYQDRTSDQIRLLKKIVRKGVSYFHFLSLFINNSIIKFLYLNFSNKSYKYLLPSGKQQILRNFLNSGCPSYLTYCKMLVGN